MRIVSGKYGGRRLLTPKGNDIRPTSDKLRGAIFNILRSREVLEGATVMDCFCGTGALGLEALSQGVESCVFIDNARDSLNLAKDNAAALKIGEEAIFILKDAGNPGARPEKIPPRTLVFLDPPYRKNLVPLALESLHKGGWLAPAALCVIEVEKEFAANLPPSFEIKDRRIYGETALILAIAPE
ncbi:MAG: 16S rRNA (guanine(966)-N(2))-methyltransferase RsmD [Alphaproteobacteria bacterium]